MNDIWTIAKLEWSNLFSYAGEHELVFDNVGATTFLVCGENGDDPGTDSNGAGKSSLFDIASWIIFGKAPRSSKVSDIITLGEDIGGGTITLTNGLMQLQITRVRAVNDSTDRKVKKLVVQSGPIGDSDALADISQRTLTLTQSVISRALGFNDAKDWEDYLSKVYFTTSTSKGFLSAGVNPKERQQTLERFLNLAKLDNAAKYAKDARKTAQGEVDQHTQTFDRVTTALGTETKEHLIATQQTLVNNIDTAEQELAGLKDQTAKLEVERSEQARLQSSCREKISVHTMLQGQAKEIKGRYAAAVEAEKQDTVVKSKWEDVKEQYDIVQGRILELATTYLPKGKDAVSQAKANAKSILDQLLQCEDKLQACLAQIDKAQTCPHCGEALMLTRVGVEKFDKDTLLQEADTLRSSLTPLQETYSDLKAKVQLANANYVKLETALTDLQRQKLPLESIRKQAEAAKPLSTTSILEEANRLTPELERAEVAVHEAESELRTTFGDRNLLTEFDTINTTYNRVTSNILDYRVQLSGIEDKLKAYEILMAELATTKTALAKSRKTVQTMAYWEKAFPQIKQLAIETFIPSFEVGVNSYLEKFGVRERVDCQLDGGFTIMVFDGSHWRDFDTFSAGEKARILVASGYALRDLSTFNASGTLGFLFVDELLDSLDTSGIDSFFELSVDIPGQKFVITHAKPDEVRSRADSLLLVRRTGDHSTVELVN